jgi:hypothetical protein
LIDEVKIVAPHVELEEIDESIQAEDIFVAILVADVSRLSKLRKALRTDHLNDEERLSLIRICEEYNDVFYLPGDKLTFTTATEHVIPTPSIEPTRGINVKPYRVPEIHKEEIIGQTEQMLRDNIIAHSTSPWNSSILVVPKKADASGVRKWRTVVDFRKLNDVTIGDSFLNPVIWEIFDELGNSQYF